MSELPNEQTHDKRTVPAFILSGFLGSGKTTLLNRCLLGALERQLNPAVLMNELGKIDVDGQLLRNDFAQLPLEKLIDGCICCSKKSEIPLALKTLLQQRPDVLFIELTGVANPEEIADALTDPALLDVVHIEQIITVIDAEHVLEYNSFFHSDKALIHTLRRQIEVADLLVVNKIECVKANTLAKVDKLIGKLNERANKQFTNFSEISLDTLFAPVKAIPDEHYPVAKRRAMFNVIRPDATVRDFEVSEGDQNPENPSFTRLQTVSFRLSNGRNVTREMIEAFIRKKTSSRSGNLMRAKGFLSVVDPRQPFAPPAVLLMQYAGKHIVWQPIEFSGDPYLVLIGLDLDIEQLQRDWHAALEEMEIK